MEAGQRPMRLPKATAFVVAGALLAVAAFVGRRLWFFSDDWNIFADYHSGNLLEPFNGHLSLLPAGLYQLAFHTLGVGSYLPFRLLGLAALAVLAFQVARFGGTRVGSAGAALAVAAVLWNSAGTTNVMFPFLMNFSLPIAALLAMWWHLDAICASSSPTGAEGGERGEAPATRSSVTAHPVALGAWATVALATSGLGVVAVAAVALEVLLRRGGPRVWFALGAPSLVWFAWWLANRQANDVSTDPTEVVPYFLRMLWAGTTSLAAGWALGGLLLAGLLVALVVASVRASGRLEPRIVSALGAAVAFAALTALTRQDTVPPIPPDELRYGWTIGAYFVLAGVAAWAATSNGTGERDSAAAGVRVVALRRAAGAGCTVVLAIGGVGLVGDMASWADTVSDAAPGLRSNIYAAEAAGDGRMDPDSVIRPLSFVPVRAGDYLAGVADVGSPLEGATAGDIGGREDQRRAADELFFSAVEPTLEIEPVLAAERECGDAVEAPPGARVIAQALGAQGAGALEAPVVGVSRFGAEAAVEIPLSRPVVAHTLSLPEDAEVGTDVVVPYRLSGSAGVTLCVDATRQGP